LASEISVAEENKGRTARLPGTNPTRTPHRGGGMLREEPQDKLRGEEKTVIRWKRRGAKA